MLFGHTVSVISDSHRLPSDRRGTLSTQVEIAVSSKTEDASDPTADTYSTGQGLAGQFDDSQRGSALLVGDECCDG